MHIDLADVNHALNNLYTSAFICAGFIFALITALGLSFTNGNRLKRHSGVILAAFLCIAVILYFGLATNFGIYIADTILYEWSFRHIDITTKYVSIFESEGLFENLQILTYNLGGNYAHFATLIASIYLITILATCYLIMRDRMWVAFLFLITSFSFFSYGTNGIRNGAACHIVILGVVLLTDKSKYKQLTAAILFLLAFMLHRSTTLPIIAALIVKYFKLNTKFAISFWFISILLSLILGNAVGELFLNLGFDDRMDRYFTAQEDIEMMQRDFAHVGFRFDFLLYSAMPVLMVWYLTIKRNFNDAAYNIIANTYILANAFWIMVIRASYSNRFAYLSWFLYPLVIAYPLLRMNIWDDQDRKTALILLAYSGFTLFMHFVYYA